MLRVVQEKEGQEKSRLAIGANLAKGSIGYKINAVYDKALEECRQQGIGTAKSAAIATHTAGQFGQIVAMLQNDHAEYLRDRAHFKIFYDLSCGLRIDLVVLEFEKPSTAKYSFIRDAIE